MLIFRILRNGVRFMAGVASMNVPPHPGAVPPVPGAVPPPRPTFSGILRDSVLAVHRLISQTADEITEAAMNRVRRVVVSILVAIAVVIAALASYLVLLGEIVEVLAEMGCHPLWRLVALVVLFAAPCIWLVVMVRSWAEIPRRRLTLSSPTALNPSSPPVPPGGLP